MGSAAAWQLASRGAGTVLLERFEPGHVRGASYGASRMFRFVYPDPFYTQLAIQALPGWRNIEAAAGVGLLTVTGGVDHGVDTATSAIAAALAGPALREPCPVPPGERSYRRRRRCRGTAEARDRRRSQGASQRPGDGHRGRRSRDRRGRHLPVRAGRGVRRRVDRAPARRTPAAAAASRDAGAAAALRATFVACRYRMAELHPLPGRGRSTVQLRLWHAHAGRGRQSRLPSRRA